MAIIKCPECNGKVSSTLDTCPHCGYKIDNNTATKEIAKEKKTIKLSQDTKRKIFRSSTLFVATAAIVGVVAGVFSSNHVRASMLNNKVHKLEKDFNSWYDACFSTFNVGKYARLTKNDNTMYGLTWNGPMAGPSSCYKEYGNSLNLYTIGKIEEQYVLMEFTLWSKKKEYNGVSLTSSISYPAVKSYYDNLVEQLKTESELSYKTFGKIRTAVSK